MSQYSLIIGQSELNEQSALISGMLHRLTAGLPFTIDPFDKISLDALIGLENLLDELAVQSAQPEHPDQPDPSE